jgi:alpha-L-rhamnosidase
MDTSGNQLKLPLWIWHEDREKASRIRLTRSLKLDRTLNNVTFHTAFTGSATISVNGSVIEMIEEKAHNVDAFSKIKSFPAKLEAGEYEIQLDLECTDIFPLMEVNSYLWNRRVGAIAFLRADDYWIVTDEQWEIAGEKAAIVCRLGEEPFGDLDNSPEWFVRGGFDDIEVFPLKQCEVLEKSELQYAMNQGVLKVEGQFRQDCLPTEYRSTKLQLFYHLRKQEQWAFMRNEQSKISLDIANWIIIDLGKEYNSRFCVSNKSVHSVNILWNGAESLQELENYVGCITETFEVKPRESFVTLPQGMRYIRLYLLGALDKDFQLEIEFQSTHVSLEQVGSLETDRLVLDRIYDVSAHTSKICHQIGLWDGVKRDRLNWTFDFYLAAKSCYFLWDDYKVIRRAVSEIGIGTPYGSWMNGICEYTLWWVKTVCEYYYYTGDKTFVMEMEEPLQRHIAWIEENMDQINGGLKHQETILIEWAPLSNREKLLGLQAILALTLKDLQQLLQAVPELNITFNWSLPTLNEDDFMQADNQLATKVLGITSGFVSEGKSIMFLENYQLEDPLTPLSAYQLAECYSSFGMHNRAYEVIAAIWGGMVSKGATTFWEAYTLDSNKDFHDALTTYTSYGSYRMSLCHAWSSTPVKWVSEAVLGVQAVEPGFAKIVFQPAAVGGIRECKGTVNTPHGEIRVYWKLDENDQLVSDIEVPDGIQVIREDTVRT